MIIDKPTLAFYCSFLLFSACTEDETKKPNFIIIQTDDLGFDDLGSSGNKIVQTPNLDLLADKSMQFSNFYVNPVCAPTRASFLTGRFFLRTGVSHVHGGKDFLNLNETTIAEVLKNNGYATGMWGKWHSGHADKYFPWQRGFEEAYMAQLYKHENSSGLLNGQAVSHNKWADEVITDYALEFISRNSDKPFLAYLSSLTCHSPLNAPEAYIKPYLDQGLSENLSVLYGMISYMDHEMGEFIQQLDSTGVLENTYIIFMSDNGPAVLNDLLTDEDRDLRYLHNLNGHKGNIWENGVKSPLFVYRKGHTREGSYQQLTDITDIFPTILDLADITLPADHLPLDGKSFAALINTMEFRDSADHNTYNYAHKAWQPTKQPWSAMGTYDEYRPAEIGKDSLLPFGEQVIYVRNQRFKLLQNPATYATTPRQENSWVLIDMINDPTEKRNVYKDYPDVAAALKQDILRWFASIISEEGSFRMPTFFLSSTSVNEIPAKAPYVISAGLKNAFSSLGEWNQTGDYAVYKIRNTEKATYRIQFTFSTEPYASRIFEVYNQNDTVKVNVHASPDGNNANLLNFIEADTLLTVKLANPGEGRLDAVWMEKIVLVPVK